MFFSRKCKTIQFLNPFYVNNFTVQFLIRLEYPICVIVVVSNLDWSE